MKKIFIAALLFLAGCGGGPGGLSQVSDITLVGQPRQITFYVDNAAGVLPSDVEVAYFIDGQNIQLQRDFFPAWSINAVVVNSPPPTSDSYCVHFLRDFSQFAPLSPDLAGIFGLHNGHQAYVNGSRCLGIRGAAEATASHEILETLADPNATMTGPPTGNQICDPVGAWDYVIGNDPSKQNAADFVLPSFFQKGSPGPWDYLKLVPGPGVSI